MNIKDYVKETRRTDLGSSPENLRFQHVSSYVFGIMSEAGEIANIFKRYASYDKVGFSHKIDLANEIGDVFWYLCRLIDRLGLDPEDVLENNIAKLKRRYPDGFDAEVYKKRGHGCEKRVTEINPREVNNG